RLGRGGGGARRRKGLGPAGPASAVTGQRSRRGRFDLAVERGLTPLVGRARDLAFLHECFDQVRGGRGQVVSVAGEAGVGKSRLAYELRRTLDGGPVNYLEGRCLPPGASLPFHAIVQLLQALFGLEEGEPERAQVEKLEAGVGGLDSSLDWTVPYVKHVLALPADELEAAGLDQTQRKRRLIEALKALLL